MTDDQREAGFDTETHAVQPGLACPPMVVGSISEDGKERLLYPREMLEWLRARLRDHTRLVTANGVFDFGVACSLDPSLIPLVFECLERGDFEDVLTNDALLEIGRGSFESMHGLAESVSKNLGEHLEKENTWRLRYGELDGTKFEEWPEDARDYPRKDAKKPLQVWRKQNEIPKRFIQTGEPESEFAEIPGEMREDDQEPGYLNLDLAIYENRAHWALQLMEIWGVRTDPEMVETVTREVTAAHEATQQKFGEAGIYRLADWCRREKQCADKPPHKFVEGQCWRPWSSLKGKAGSKDGEVLKALVTEAYDGQPPMTESGEDVCTDRDVLMESGSDLLISLGSAGANEKDFSQYLKVVAEGCHHPICVAYNLILKTCRCSCRSPNLQNLPTGGRSRECFVPRNFRDPDVRNRFVFCSTDYPSLELWTLAEACLEMFGSSDLAQFLRSGLDMHTKLVATVTRMSYEEALALKKSGDKTMSKRRRCAKEVNYGLGGGMSDETLLITARKKGIKFCEGLYDKPHDSRRVVGTKGKATGRPLCVNCLEQVRDFVSAWFAMLPEMRDYRRAVQQEVDAGLVVVPSPEGLPVLYCADRGRNEGLNLKFQGRAARAAKDGIWRVAKACYIEKDSPLYGCHPALFVHDDLVTEMPEERAHEAAVEQARLLGEALRTWCPQVYNEKACPSPSLMRRWFKADDPVKNAAGRHDVFWPKKWDWAPDQEIMRDDLARRASNC